MNKEERRPLRVSKLSARNREDSGVPSLFFETLWSAGAAKTRRRFWWSSVRKHDDHEFIVNYKKYTKSLFEHFVLELTDLNERKKMPLNCHCTK